MKPGYEYFALSSCQYIAFNNPYGICGPWRAPSTCFQKVWHYFHFQICLGFGAGRHGIISASKKVKTERELEADRGGGEFPATAVSLPLTSLSSASGCAQQIPEICWRKWMKPILQRDRGLDKESNLPKVTQKIRSKSHFDEFYFYDFF